jgi:methionine-rich copper-binding protein CopC
MAALSLAALLLTAPHAAAHTVLTGSDPAADATLDAGPARVTATFNEDLQPTFAAMTVVGPDGNLWSQGDTVVKGPAASVGLRPLGPSGRYTVNYRVTSDDGHVVSGAWSFTVKVASTGAPGPAAAPATQDRIPLWPFIVGVAVLAAGAVAWGLRRRS